jgi:hypothetical protein
MLKLNHRFRGIVSQSLIVLMLCFCIVSFTNVAKAAQVVLVFDNSLQPGSSLQARTRSQMLIRNLATVEVKQAGFLIDTYGLKQEDEDRLALYNDAGHLLINAGYNDSLVSKKNMYTMQVNLLKADAWLQIYPAYKKHVHLDWVNETTDFAARQEMIHFLQEHQFKSASSGVTRLRAVDDYINQLYQKRKQQNKSVNMQNLEKAYTRLIIQDLELQDAYASFTLGYSPIHILTLQENDLAAYFIIGLVDELNKNGWQVVEAGHAFSDPVANAYGFFGFATNTYWKSVAPFIDDAVSYPRVIADRKLHVDQVLQQTVPEILQ